MGNLCSNQNNRRVMYAQNRAWDLMDRDGDNKVSPKELETIATILHQKRIDDITTSLKIVSSTSSVEYVLQLVNKKPTDKIIRRDFKQIIGNVPFSTWHDEILPALRRQEIQHLSKSM